MKTSISIADFWPGRRRGGVRSFFDQQVELYLIHPADNANQSRWYIHLYDTENWSRAFTTLITGLH